MRPFAVLVLLIMVAAQPAVSDALTSLQQLNSMPDSKRLELMRNMFEEFKLTYNRKYAASDEPVRFDVFQVRRMVKPFMPRDRAFV